MAITSAGMLALRIAATVVDVLPGARLEVRDGDRVLVSVSQDPICDPAHGYVMSATGFRAAVVRAHHHMSCHGARFGFLGLPEDREPSVRVELPAGGEVLAGDVYRSTLADGRDLLMFVSSLDAETAAQVVESVRKGHRRAGGTAGPSWPVGFHDDVLTGLTVIHLLVTGDRSDQAARLMSSLLEACVAAEVVAEMEGVSLG